MKGNRPNSSETSRSWCLSSRGVATAPFFSVSTSGKLSIVDKVSINANSPLTCFVWSRVLVSISCNRQNTEDLSHLNTFIWYTTPLTLYYHLQFNFLFVHALTLKNCKKLFIHNTMVPGYPHPVTNIPSNALPWWLIVHKLKYFHWNLKLFNIEKRSTTSRLQALLLNCKYSCSTWSAACWSLLVIHVEQINRQLMEAG